MMVLRDQMKKYSRQFCWFGWMSLNNATRHLSSYRCVGGARAPESLTYVSLSGFTHLPPSCILKYIE